MSAPGGVLLALGACDLARAERAGGDLTWARAGDLALALTPTPAASVTSPSRGDVLAFSERVHALWREVEDLAPMRFGAAFSDLAEAEELLATRRAALAGALERARGRVEFSLRAPLPELPAAADPDPGPTSALGAGASYLLRRRAAHAQRDGRARRIALAIDAARAALGGLVVDVAPPPPRGLTERDPDAPSASLSLLVARADADALRDAVASLGPPHALLGPFPCFSFAAA